MENKWWKEANFEVDGIPCTFYVWPDDRLIILKPSDSEPTNKFNNILIVPTFDVREVGKSLKQNVMEAVEYYKATNPDKQEKVYCSVIRYKSNRSEIGICTYNKPMRPVTKFSPEEDSCIKRKPDRADEIRSYQHLVSSLTLLESELNMR